MNRTIQDVIDEMKQYVADEVEPDLDQIAKWANELQAYRDNTRGGN